MSNSTPAVGTIGWHDLTVEDAEQMRDFYSAVVGWKSEPVDMGDYNDFNMIAPASGEPTGGVCHKRGSNEDLPTQWLMYVNVDDLDQSMTTCRELGGEIISGPKAHLRRISPSIIPRRSQGRKSF